MTESSYAKSSIYLVLYDGTVYTYDANGLRIKKVSGGVTSQYFWHNDRLYAEKRGNDYIEYFYDTSGIRGMSLNGTKYTFLKNLWGDVIQILDANGVYAGGYGYDAYGNQNDLMSELSPIARVNPFRYRGYYQDAKTGYHKKFPKVTSTLKSTV